MNYKEFTNFITAYMEDTLGDDCQVAVVPVTKNNHHQMDGLYIKQKNQSASPIIYLNPFYTRYQNGELFHELAKEIARMYERGARHAADFQFSIEDFREMEPYVIFRLVNYQENEEMLKTIPHRRFLDLAIVYSLLVDCCSDGMASALINDAHLVMWKKTEEELYQAALANTPKLLPYQFRPLEDILFELYQEADSELLAELPLLDIVLDSPTLPMYVLSNSFCIHGAGCILYPDLLETIAEKLSSDFFILPSSIHEVIFVPSTQNLTAISLQEMVLSVNQTQLPSTDILSDSVYLYQRKYQRLDII